MNEQTITTRGVYGALQYATKLEAVEAFKRLGFRVKTQ